MAAPVINTPAPSNIASRRPMAGLWPLPNRCPASKSPRKLVQQSMSLSARTCAFVAYELLTSG